MEIRMYLSGTGESLGKVKGVEALRGYDIVSAWVDRMSGMLMLSVKPNRKIVPLGKKGYVCYADGRVKKNDVLLKPEEKVNYFGVDWDQDKAILWAFNGKPLAKGEKAVVIHLNGDKHDNRIENLRWS